MNNMKQVALALASYESQNECFPPHKLNPGFADGISWTAAILPHLGEEALFRQIRIDKTASAPENIAAGCVSVPAFICPSAESGRWVDARLLLERPGQLAITDYPTTQGVGATLRPYVASPRSIGNTGIMARNVRIRASEVTDGLANTIIIGEAAGRPQKWKRGHRVAPTANQPYSHLDMHSAWIDPNNGIQVFGMSINGESAPPGVVQCYNYTELYSFHNGGVNTANADGSVHFLSATTTPAVVASLISRNAGD